MAAINPRVLAWFRGRGISEAILDHMQVSSGQRQRIGDVVEITPNTGGEIIMFPYCRKGQVVNTKYREAGKRFHQKLGGKAVFYNGDVIEDPQLLEGRAALVIVEGEMDCLAVQSAGNPFVVSVPNGAPPEASESAAGELPPPEEDDRYAYVYNDWEGLKKVKQIVIATDDDPPGRRLAEELVRRLGRVRCSFVVFPDDCKDMNEVLLIHGPAAVAELIARAKPYPVSGIYTYNDLPAEPDLNPVTTGFGRLDDYIRPFYPSLMVVTGFAGSGKSSWVNQLVGNLSILHQWKAGIASFEMRIRPFISGTLLATYHEAGQRGDALEWLNRNFVFIAPEPGVEDKVFDVEWLIEKAIAAVIRHGIRVLVIDPWNEIEHAVDRKESGTEYIGRTLRALKRFGREFECLVIVVAHPTKIAATKNPEDVTLYDIDGSAHFSNKADLGVVIARKGGEESYISEVFVKKVRYQPDTGKLGSVTLTYDPAMRIFGQ